MNRFLTQNREFCLKNMYLDNLNNIIAPASQSQIQCNTNFSSPQISAFDIFVREFQSSKSAKMRRSRILAP